MTDEHVRIVLDTNVLVSGLLNPSGPPGRIVDLLLEGMITVLLDDRILIEYRAVLARPRFGFDQSDIETFLAWLDTTAEHVLAKPLSLVLEDPADLAFVEVAHAGRAEALVTGNARHFRKAASVGVRVVSPSAFMET